MVITRFGVTFMDPKKRSNPVDHAVDPHRNKRKDVSIPL